MTDKITKQVTTQRTTNTDYDYFFPEELKVKANANTEAKYRNNYESAVFNAQMNFKGHYMSPNFSSQNIKPESIDWEKASILINTNNLKSIKGAVNINFNGKTYAFEPVAKENENDTPKAKRRSLPA